MNSEKVNSPKYIRASLAVPLFWLCWFSYFAANMGRLSYTSSVAILLSEGRMSSPTAGLIGTGFFLCYGLGQPISGYIGDKLQPKYMVGVGLFLTAVINSLFTLMTTGRYMVFLWAANGLVQSLLWPPILRIMAEKLPPKYRNKAYINMATTFPIATLASYFISGMVANRLPWQWTFYIATGIIAVCLIAWMYLYDRLTVLENHGEDGHISDDVNKDIPKKEKISYPVVAIGLFCIAMIFLGALRDGVMTWVPTFLADSYKISVGSATFSATLLPLFNIVGITGTRLLYDKKQDEIYVSLVMFVTATLSALFLRFIPNVMVSIIAFSLVTASTVGINLMMVSFVPSYFVRHGKVAFLSGFINSMVYVGSSISTFGFGWIADRLGWNIFLTVILVITVLGTFAVLIASPFWKAFVDKQRQEK